MNKALIYILVMMMGLTACSSSDTTEEPQPGQQKPTMLTIYVYSPEHPVLTRADVGPVNPLPEESKVTLLQIWVYDTNGNKVGYLRTEETATLNGSEGAVYQIPVSDDFAKNKPNVDVYVLANVHSSNCGITTSLEETTTRTDLLANAKIATSCFGLAPLRTAVPEDGLPMAGELKNKPVFGDAPVLRIGTTEQIATVSLTRAVSKLRFVFANTTGSPTLGITGISLKTGMIPNEEYLFPQAQTLTYNNGDAPLLSTETAIAQVAEKQNPADYVYNGQTAQAYEDLLNGAGLTQTSTYYLRESDKQLEGTISYTIDNVAQTPATFKMSAAGDFLRNHSWIVYAYYEGLSGMQVVTVDVTPWEERDGSHTVYNW
jgi:hypothetical protein